MRFSAPWQAGMQVPGSSDILCVMWAIRQRSDTQPSRCEVFAVTLAVVAPAGAPGGDAGPSELHVTEVKLLKVRELQEWQCVRW